MKYELMRDIPGFGNAGEIKELESLKGVPMAGTLRLIVEEKKPEVSEVLEEEEPKKKKTKRRKK